MLTVKRITLIFICFIAGFAAIVALSVVTRQPRGLYEELERYWGQRRAVEAVRQAERLLTQDTYGGLTPEETFTLLLDALRAGDVDLASKYFVLHKQEEWRDRLQNFKKNDSLVEITEEWQRTMGGWNKITSEADLSKYSYETEVKSNREVKLGNQTINILPGVYSNTVTFQRNRKTSLWKINQL